VAVRWRLHALVGALALIAVVSAVLARPELESASATGGPTMALNVSFPTGHCDDVNNPTKCTFPLGTQFKLAVIADNPPVGGYTGFDVQLALGGLIYKPAAAAADELTWPQPATALHVNNPGLLRYAAAAVPVSNPPFSNYIGTLAEFAITCPTSTGSHSTAILAGPDPKVSSFYEVYPGSVVPKAVGQLSAGLNFADRLQVNCQSLPTFTPTPTPTGPTATPTSTPTAVPTPSGPPQMILRAPSLPCDAVDEPTKCAAVIGSQFTVLVSAKSIPSQGYTSYQTQVLPGSLIYKPQLPELEHIWPDGVQPLRADTAPSNGIVHGNSSGFGPAPTISFFTGDILQLAFTCSLLGAVDVRVGGYDPLSNPFGSTFLTGTTVKPLVIIGTEDARPIADQLQVNCVEPPTPTPTPTATPTPEAPSVIKGPSLENLWLTRQGAKIPPATCLGGSDYVDFTQRVDVPPSGLDKHGEPRTLGAFQFDLQYDETKVCIELLPGSLPNAWLGQGGACIIQDSVTAPTQQGVAKISCNALGKEPISPSLSAEDSLQLATIRVRPMPDVYSQVVAPNNGNGVVVQLINSACKLGDTQGDPIAPPPGAATCTDADVTIRYLEADVDPDCSVDTADTQAIAFRWNSAKGGLLYNSRFNVEPSAPQKDNDIDVNDLQFVYGRFLSTCEDPWPLQPPMNPKT
jgi:hypothetical protein